MAIAIIAGASGAFNATTGSVTLAFSAGESMVMMVHIRNNNSQTVNQFDVPAAPESTFRDARTNGTDVRTELWTADPTDPGLNPQATLSLQAKWVMCVERYSGAETNTAQRWGNKNGATGSGTGPSFTVTTTRPNSWLVGGFGAKGKSVSITAGGGQTQRQSNTTAGGADATNITGDLEDEGAIVSAPSTITFDATLGASTPFACSAIELRAPLEAQFVNPHEGGF